MAVPKFLCHILPCSLEVSVHLLFQLPQSDSTNSKGFVILYQRIVFPSSPLFGKVPRCLWCGCIASPSEINTCPPSLPSEHPHPFLPQPSTIWLPPASPWKQLPLRSPTDSKFPNRTAHLAEALVRFLSSQCSLASLTSPLLHWVSMVRLKAGCPLPAY